jgi:MbtH protein
MVSSLLTKGCAARRKAGRHDDMNGPENGSRLPEQECLDYIKEVWTDMRPLSLRKRMEGM